MNEPAVDDATHIILLDACSLLNLYASNRFQAIATAMGWTFVLVDRAQTEALYVRRGGAGEDAGEREQVDSAALISAAVLSVVTLLPGEITTFAAFADDVDDGEAATCAVAFHRGYDVATDDRKARRLLREHIPHVYCYSTLELLKLWADGTAAAADDLRETLIAVRDRGNFLPPKADPLRAWWEATLAPHPPPR